MTRRYRRLAHLALLAAPVVLWTSGCGEARVEDSEAGPQVTDSAGVEIIVNEASYGPDATPLEIVEDLRIGALESERDELMFHGIHDILVDAEGRIFVGDDQSGSVRVFGEDGTFVREFGGKGEGPAEIPHLLNDLMWAGDRIAVIDWQGGGKLILFDTTGVFVNSWSNVQVDGGPVFPTGYTPEGWVTVRSDRTARLETVPGRAYPSGRRMRRLSADLDSLGEVLFELPPSVLYGSAATHGLDWPLFQPVVSSGFDAEGRYYRSAEGEYRIDVRDAAGRHIRSIRRAYDPIPITLEDIEAYKKRVRDRLDTMSMFDEAQRARQIERSMERIDQQTQFPRPETRPPLGPLLVARDGALWVERQDAREPAEWWMARMSGGFDDTTAGGDELGRLLRRRPLRRECAAPSPIRPDGGLGEVGGGRREGRLRRGVRGPVPDRGGGTMMQTLRGRNR